MQSPDARRPPDKRLLLKVVVLAGVLLVAGVLALLGFDWKEAIHRSLEAVRNAGPLPFFAAMALLPAFGFPMSPFTLSVGPAFGPTLGLPAVIGATFAALTVNVLVSYVLARWLLRPLLERLILRLGYRMPEVGADNFWDVALLLRVTPGPPFFVQSYLLGLARVPLGIYLVCSLGVAWLYALGLVMFGEALLHGRARLIALAVAVIVAAGVATHLVRKHIARKRAAG